MEKIEIINLMAERIESEHRKHKELDWSKIVAHKIYNTLTELSIIPTMVEAPDYELNFCDKCFQMTNHLDGICQKCKVEGNE